MLWIRRYNEKYIIICLGQGNLSFPNGSNSKDVFFFWFPCISITKMQVWPFVISIPNRNEGLFRNLHVEKSLCLAVWKKKNRIKEKTRKTVWKIIILNTVKCMINIWEPENGIFYVTASSCDVKNIVIKLQFVFRESLKPVSEMSVSKSWLF